MAKTRVATALWLLAAKFFGWLAAWADVLEAYCLGEINNPREYIKSLRAARKLLSRLDD